MSKHWIESALEIANEEFYRAHLQAEMEKATPFVKDEGSIVTTIKGGFMSGTKINPTPGMMTDEQCGKIIRLYDTLGQFEKGVEFVREPQERIEAQELIRILEDKVLDLH